MRSDAGEPLPKAAANRAEQGFAFTVSAFIVLFVAAVIAQLLGVSDDLRTHTSTLIWPVAWQFYVHSADAEFVVAYRYEESTHAFTPLTRPAADTGHRWGFDRSAYGDLARLTSSARTVPAQAWRGCVAETVDGCSGVVASAPRTAVVSPWTSVYGLAVLAVERPSGWQDGASRRVVRIAVVDLVRSG